LIAETNKQSAKVVEPCKKIDGTTMLAMTTVVAVPCRCCNEVTELKVDFEQFTKWQQGELIQNALPELNADQRELLISGTCPTCWDMMFPSDEE